MSSNKWKTGLDKAHAKNLPLIFTALLCIQILATLRVPIIIGWDLPLWLILSDAILILINVCLVLWIRTESPSEKLYYPLTTFAYLCAGIKVITSIIVQEDPIPFYLAVLMLSGSLCFLSIRYLVFSMALVILGWVAVALPILSVAEITSILVVPLIGAALSIYVQHRRILAVLQILELKHSLATLLKQKALELNKAQIELQSQAIVDNAVDGIITINDSGLLESFNPAAESLFGYSAGEVIGQNIKMLMPEPYHSEHDSYLSNYRNTGDKKIIGIGREVVARRKDGSTFPIDLGISETQTSEGRMFTGIVRDITARKAIEEKLNLALQAAESSSEAKASFLANMSHEIRTPMSGVIGMAEILVETKLSDDQLEIVQTIRDSGHSLLIIINDILDISKIEAGMLSLERIEMSLADTVESAVSALSVVAAAADIKLVTSIESELPAKVLGDPVRLRQVLFNLLGNAIKFSNNGSEVTTRVELLKVFEQANALEVCISVSDQGIGMSKEAQKTLFDAFTQAEVSTTRKYGGTGLGLSICQRLVEMMGGSIDVKSEMGKGTTFSINLVFKVATETMERAESAGIASPQVQINDGVENAEKTEVSVPSVEEALSQGRLILVAEDNVVNQKVIGRQLAMLGYQCEIASDGKEALVMWQEKPYGIVLSDCHMPKMDGYDLARAIRQEEADKGKGRIPIVAFTANAAQREEAGRCKAAGMDDYLAKPVAIKDLGVMLQKWLDKDVSVGIE